jgi:hypothetical protein
VRARVRRSPVRTNSTVPVSSGHVRRGELVFATDDSTGSLLGIAMRVNALPRCDSGLWQAIRNTRAVWYGSSRESSGLHGLRVFPSLSNATFGRRLQSCVRWLPRNRLDLLCELVRRSEYIYSLCSDLSLSFHSPNDRYGELAK